MTRVLTLALSNWLTIHDGNTREITTVNEVSIPGLNLHRFRRFHPIIFSVLMTSLRSYTKHSKECFIRYPNISKLVKKTRLRLVFPCIFPVFEDLDKTLFLAFGHVTWKGDIKQFIGFNIEEKTVAPVLINWNVFKKGNQSLRCYFCPTAGLNYDQVTILRAKIIMKIQMHVAAHIPIEVFCI